MLYDLTAAGMAESVDAVELSKWAAGLETNRYQLSNPGNASCLLRDNANPEPSLRNQEGVET